MRTSDFHYDLPDELIAQAPAASREGSRLLVMNRTTGTLIHRHFTDLPNLLQPGDVLVLNDSRVIPARLHGLNARTNGRFEILLVAENGPNDWWTMMRPGKRAPVGATVILLDCSKQPTELKATVTGVNTEGHRRLRFSGGDLTSALDSLGELPLPPYISRPQPREDDRERYQTVYAQQPGSVAAPTAGLHFTNEILRQITAKGVEIARVTLHVGLGTFAPVKAETLEGHRMHEERFSVSEETAATINEAKQDGRRVVAVGTTTVRVLESLARTHNGRLIPGNGRTNIFLYPPAPFLVVNALVTNFHLPCSTLLMLVSAFATPGETRGKELVLETYRKAIDERYRFFSYGDAMLLV